MLYPVVQMGQGEMEVTWREGFSSNPPLDVSPPSGPRYAEEPWGLEQVAAGLADNWLSRGLGLGNASSVHCRPLSSLTPSTSSGWDLKTQLQNLANWMWRGQNKHLPFKNSLVWLSWDPGSWRPSALSPSHSALGSVLHVSTNPMSCASPRWHCLLSLLSLLFHGKLTWRRCFYFLSTHWLIRIPCDQIFITMIATENLHQSFTQKPNNILREKDVGYKWPEAICCWHHLKIDCQDRLCPH